MTLAALGLLYAAAPAMAQEKKITVWFGKGFYKSEDDALLEAIVSLGNKLDMTMLAEPAVLTSAPKMNIIVGMSSSPPATPKMLLTSPMPRPSVKPVAK